MKKEIRSLLVVGSDVASLVKSASKTGYDVYSVDYFGDTDLKKVSKKSLSIITQTENKSCGRFNKIYTPEKIVKSAKNLLRKVKIDGILVSGGLDDHPELLSELNDFATIIGNKPEVMSRVRDKVSFFKELDHLGIHHPLTEVIETLEEAYKKAREIGYPLIIKSEKGFGGTHVRLVKTPERFGQAFKSVFSPGGRLLIQEYVKGMPISASLISTVKEAITLTVNEQLLGLRCLGQRDKFGYCGNIVPISISIETVKKLKLMAERITVHFGLLGSNGVDFVLSEGEAKVIEVNPRFQGSLECVEKVLETSVSEAHINACIHEVLPTIKMPTLFCSRIILFAKKRSKIPDLTQYKEVRDIPLPGVIVELGEPICSIIVEGSSRKFSLSKALDVAKNIFSKIHSYI